MSSRFVLLVITIIIASSAPAAPQTLEAIKKRGTLNCGVSQGLPGFSAQDGRGNWTGFDVDFCRALASAIFDDAGKVTFTPLAAEERFSALRAGRIDVLSRNSTWTLSREVELKINFAATTYYDGQGFLVRKSRNANSALELDNSKVCVQSGTTSELNLEDHFVANKLKYEMIKFGSADEMVKAYDSGRCDVLTSDVSQLHAERLKLSRPAEHVILPDIISKEPLGPAVRQGDADWFNLVRWTHYAMLNAEELGVSSKTLDEALKSTKPDVKRLVGGEGAYGEQLGLTRDWAARIVRHVGNYEEVFERNLGTRTPLGIPRGINHLWSKGGIQYAPPIR